jgi:hypothetical protein
MLNLMQNPIDALELIVKLQSFALGDNPGAMSDAQVAAGLGLLNKILPDQAELRIIGHESSPVGTRLVNE